MSDPSAQSLEARPGLPVPLLPRSYLAAFFLATLAGAFLRYLYLLRPNVLTALLSPVGDSVWEYGKVLFYPYLAAAFALTRGKRCGWAPHLLALLVISIVMPLLCTAVDLVIAPAYPGYRLVLYVLLMACGFLLSGATRTSARLDRHCRLLGILVILAAALLVLFTFFPPEGFLFDGTAVRQTFRTIPV